MDTLFAIILFVVFAYLSQKQEKRTPRRPPDLPPLPQIPPQNGDAQTRGGTFEIPTLRNAPKRADTAIVYDKSVFAEDAAETIFAPVESSKPTEEKFSKTQRKILPPPQIAADEKPNEQEAQIIPSVVTAKDLRAAVVFAEIIGRPKAVKNMMRRRR